MNEGEQLDDATVECRKRRFDEVGQQRFEACVRTLLVDGHEARIAKTSAVRMAASLRSDRVSGIPMLMYDDIFHRAYIAA